MLEAIAENLEVSAETLKRQRKRSAQGDAQEGEEPPVVAAIRADKGLTSAQRRALIEIYESFTAERGGPGDED